ncbi:MAG: hypothetical protein ACOYEW_04895 [Anaerolineae bacterium]|jgi:hypothetical protein
MRPPRRLAGLLPVMILLLAVACGLPGPTPQVGAVTPPPRPTPTTPTSSGPASGRGAIARPRPTATPVRTAEVTDEILSLVNADREAQGLPPLIRDAELDALAAPFAASGHSDAVAEEHNLDHLLMNSWYVTYDGGPPTVDANTAREQVDYCLGEERLREVLRHPDARRTGLGMAIVGQTMYFAQVFDVLSALGGDGRPIELHDNPEAVDVSWEELKAFLRADDLDGYPYEPSSFVCADFAEALHNRAEEAGIRTAYVAVEFSEGPGHALNAFLVQGSIVYIDPQGDQVAYIQEGKGYGVISLDGAHEFTYDYYERYTEWVRQWEEDLRGFNAEVEAFNAELAEYEAAVDEHNTNPTQDSYDRLSQWQVGLDGWAAELDAWHARLMQREAELGLADGYYTQTPEGVAPSTVTRVYVHW